MHHFDPLFLMNPTHFPHYTFTDRGRPNASTFRRNCRKKNEKTELLSQIKNLEDRLSYLRELLITGKIESEDCATLKTGCVGHLEKLEVRLTNASQFCQYTCPIKWRNIKSYEF